MSRARSSGGPALAAALAALAACSEPARPPVPATPTVVLSSDNPDTNAPAVAAFVRRTCLDAASDAEALSAALAGSGWAHERLPASEPAMSISLWRLDYGELIHAQAELGPGARVVDCQLELDGTVAPSLERMRDALRSIIRQPSMRELDREAQEVGWQWSQGATQEWRLTVGPTAAPRPGAQAERPGIAIHAAITERPPAPALPPEPEGNLEAGTESQ